MQDSIVRLNRILDDIRGNLVRSTGGKSVCSIHKHGNPSDALKYNEGEEFVVRRTISLLSREAGEAEILSFLSDQTQRFRKYRSSRIASSAWQAYADGGLEGIERIRDALHIPSHSARR